jgi:hypothetical protein
VNDWSSSLTQVEILVIQATDKFLEAGGSPAWRTPSQRKALRDARRLLLGIQARVNEALVWAEDSEG